MKKSITVIIVLSAILIGILIFSKSFFEPFKNTNTLIHKIGCRLYDFNTIKVIVDDSIDINEITIKAFDNIVYKNGKQFNRLGTHYGNNILNIYHEGEHIGELGHYKTNNWHVHDYIFNIQNKENQFLVSLEIIGPNGTNDDFQNRFTP